MALSAGLVACDSTPMAPPTLNTSDVVGERFVPPDLPEAGVDAPDIPDLPEVAVEAGPTCDGGLSACGAACVDLQTDYLNCGMCGNRCSAGNVCVAGRCAVGCGMLTECVASTMDGGAPDASAPRICADTMTNPQHCGGCFRTCSGSQVCVAGMCREPECSPGLAYCNVPLAMDGGAAAPDAPSERRCVDLQNDSRNCGTCNTVCASGTRCVAGRCEVGCQTGLTDCMGRCLNLRADNANCGMCGRACMRGFSCVDGDCVAECLPPLTRCNPDAGASSCMDLRNDPANCGVCGRACVTRQQCVNGTCQYVCFPGQTLCGTACTDLDTDTANCGRCGTACARGLACIGGTCQPTCASPLRACPLGSSMVCIDPLHDLVNCGACGNACGVGRQCSGGLCCPTVTAPTESVPACSPDPSCSAAFVQINGQAFAQGISPTVSGNLVRARIHVTNPNAVRGMAMEVFLVPGMTATHLSTPVMTMMGMTSTLNVERDAIGRTTVLGSRDGGWADVLFSPPPRVVAGNHYFLVVRLPAPTTCVNPCTMGPAGCDCPPVRWTRVSNDATMRDPYTRGKAFSCGAGCPLWTAEPDWRDHVFEAYVTTCDGTTMMMTP